jgi:hypothetical protein
MVILTSTSFGSQFSNFCESFNQDPFLINILIASHLLIIIENTCGRKDMGDLGTSFGAGQFP